VGTPQAAFLVGFGLEMVVLVRCGLGTALKSAVWPADADFNTVSPPKPTFKKVVSGPKPTKNAGFGGGRDTGTLNN